MRTYTLAFSIVIHGLIVCGAIVAPIVASDQLPEPRRAVEFVQVIATTPPVPPPPAAARSQSGAVSNPHAAPVNPPETIEPEKPFEPFEAGVREGGVPGGDPGSVPFSVCNRVLPPPPPPSAPQAPTNPIRVGGTINPPQKVRHVPPVYPALAIAVKKEGTVILDAVIGEDGRIRNLRVLRSIPLLDEAAMEAVRQWQFTPTLLNGQPVPVVMTVTVTFTLAR
jgi:protein TonB